MRRSSNNSFFRGSKDEFADMVEEIMKGETEIIPQNIESSFLMGVDVSESPANDIVKYQRLLTLQKLLDSLKDLTALAWRVISLIERACGFINDEQAFFIMQGFVPKLFELFPMAQTIQKKGRILNIMQTLTYGMNIGKLDPYLPLALQTLMTYCTNETTDVNLALSVLVNILHNNNYAVFTLVNHQDFKGFMKHILSLNITELSATIEICKLTMMMQSAVTSENHVEDNLLFVDLTFKLVHDESVSGATLSRTVKFFLNVVEGGKLHYDISNSSHIAYVENIVSHLKDQKQSLIVKENATDLFLFLTALVRLNSESFYHLYPSLVETALEFITTRALMIPQSLDLSCVILEKVEKGALSALSVSQIDNIFIDKFPLVVLRLLEPEQQQKTIDHNTYYTFQLKLLNLLSYGVRKPNLLKIMKNNLNAQELGATFLCILEKYSLLPDVISNVKAWACVYFLDFISELVHHDTSWLTTCQSLFLDHRVVKLLGMSLKHGDEKLIATGLSIISSSMFSGKSMGMLSKILGDNTIGSGNCPQIDSVFTSKSLPNQSVIDKLIKKLHSCSLFQDISVPEVIELYDHKVKLMEQNEDFLHEKIMQASAVYNNMYMQHLVSQKMHVTLKNQVSLERKCYLEIQEAYSSLKAAAEVMEKEKIEDYAVLERKLAEATTTAEKIFKDFEVQKNRKKELQRVVESLNERNAEIINELSILKEECTQLKLENHSMNTKLLETAEQVLEGKTANEKLKAANKELAIEKNELEQENQTLLSRLNELEEIHRKKDKELEELRRIRDTICEITGGKKRC